jgi:GMP synthase (glutamine-hydrolysing)
MNRGPIAVCIILLLFVASVACESWGARTDRGRRADRASGMAAPGVPSVWVVVNLFGGRTSKQAERVRDTLAQLEAPGRGIVLPYSAITVERIKELNPAFLALSPNGIPWCRYRGKNGLHLANFLRALKVIVEELNVPVIGICGGHQALALAFGGKVGPIRGGEDDCLPYGNNPTERGRQYVKVLMNDPIFLGMGQRLNMVQNHYDEVKRLPQGFLTLASNKMCPHQIIRHPNKPAYGVQAHSEYYFGTRPDGGMLLRNFIAIAERHNRLRDALTKQDGPRAGSSAVNTKLSRNGSQ